MKARKGTIFIVSNSANILDTFLASIHFASLTQSLSQQSRHSHSHIADTVRGNILEETEETVQKQQGPLYGHLFICTWKNKLGLLEKQILDVFSRYH